MVLADYMIDLAEEEPTTWESHPDQPRIQRGECPAPYGKIAIVFDWDRPKVCRLVAELEKRDFLSRRTVGATQTVIVTLRNYRRYQDTPPNSATVPATVPTTVPTTGIIIEEEGRGQKEEVREDKDKEKSSNHANSFEERGESPCAKSDRYWSGGAKPSLVKAPPKGQEGVGVTKAKPRPLCPNLNCHQQGLTLYPYNSGKGWLCRKKHKGGCAEHFSIEEYRDPENGRALLNRMEHEVERRAHKEAIERFDADELMRKLVKEMKDVSPSHG